MGREQNLACVQAGTQFPTELAQQEQNRGSPQGQELPGYKQAATRAPPGRKITQETQRKNMNSITIKFCGKASHTSLQ